MQERENTSKLYFLRNNDKFVELHLSDFLLCHVYSKTVLETLGKRWETLPFYVQSEVPSEIRQKAFSGYLKDSETFLSEYWLKKANNVLSGYQASEVPFSADSRVEKSNQNLLSQKGEKELVELQNALKAGKIDEETTLRAINASNKFLLDLSLFTNFDKLKASTYYLRPQFGKIILSLSSGCYNHCSHCGFSATAPVSHMPYPIFLQLLHLFGRNLRSPQGGVSQFYSDSDPISYRDPIIGADIGDVSRYVQTQLPLDNVLLATIVTKGVLQKKDEAALAKSFEWNPISLSFVDLPGEKNIAKNKERIKRSLSVLQQVPKERRMHDIIEFRHICLSDGILDEQDFNLSDEILKSRINPIFNGRWVETFSQEKLPFQERGRSTGFSSFADTVIKPDGNIYKCELKSGGFNFRWNVLGNIFDFSSKERE